MLIKAGTYRFNDVYTLPGGTLEQGIEFSFSTFSPDFGISVFFICDTIKVGLGNSGMSYRAVYAEPDISSMGFVLPAWSKVCGPEFWNTGSLGEGIKTITISNDTEVSAEFYEWFTANAVKQKTIKAGTYRFNDVLTAPPNDEVRANINFTVTATVGSDTFTETFYSISVYFDGDSLEFLYWDKDHLRSTQPYSNGWPEYEGCQFITIPNGTEVSADFYEWFTANAVEKKQISGVWKFNDVLTDYAHINENVNYTCNAYSRLFGVGVMANCSGIASGAFAGEVEGGLYCYVESTVPDLSAYGFVCPRYVRVYQADGWNTGAFEIKDKCIYFGTTPQYVSADFYNWMTANASLSVATITHNGSTIAELFPGQTATLKCKGMKMEDDVVVAVGELPETEVVEPIEDYDGTITIV